MLKGRNLHYHFDIDTLFSLFAYHFDLISGLFAQELKPTSKEKFINPFLRIEEVRGTTCHKALRLDLRFPSHSEQNWALIKIIPEFTAFSA